jgi:DNA-binding response OmpR family regulator
MLSARLTHWGYKAIVASEGETALQLAATHPLGLALLDARMSGLSGMELAGRLKELQPEMEVIIIAAHGSVQEAVEAMYQGAFYYLLKPLDLELLQTRVDQAWAKQWQQAPVRVGELVIDLREGQATLRGNPAELTSLEYQILACLARRQGQVVSYDELWREGWGYEGPPDKGLIQRAMSRLREKLDEAWIVCIRRRGYRLG